MDLMKELNGRSAKKEKLQNDEKPRLKAQEENFCSERKLLCDV